jgi:hypothetical protein
MKRRRGGTGLSSKGLSSKGFEHLIVHHRGRRGVKDAALAEKCGFPDVQQMYRRLGQKLLELTRSCWFEIRSDKSDSEQDPPRRVYIFTLSGVMMIAAWLRSDRALEVAMALAPLLSVRRRASKNKQRRPRRQDDPPRQGKYQTAWTRFEAQRSKLEKK